MSSTKWGIPLLVICWCAGFVSNSLFIEKQTTENGQFSIAPDEKRFRSEYEDKSITGERTIAEKHPVVTANRKRRNSNMDLSNTTQSPRTQTNTATLFQPQPKVRQTPKPLNINCYEDDLSCKGRCQQERQAGTKDLERGHCYCDPYCESFKDCCADFDQFCTGIVDTTKKLNDKWRCYDDIWMIKSCLNNFTSIDVIQKCQNNAKMSASNYADVIPVTSTTGKTYKNRFCALCNGVKERDIKSLSLQFRGCKITPPESYGIKEKIQFLFGHCNLKKLETTGEQQIRKCSHITEMARSYCSHFDQIERIGCEQGPYRIVFALAGFRNYKNVYCARCEGIRDEDLACGPKLNLGVDSKSKLFTAILDIDGTTDTKVIKSVRASCPIDQVYDTFLETCRKGLQFPSKKSSPKLDKYNVALWIKSVQNPNGLTIKDYPLELIFHSLSRRLGLQARVFQFVEWQNLVSPSIDLLVVNLYSDYNTTERAKRYSSSSQYSIDRILNFTQPVEFKIFGDSFTIIKATARLLTCVRVEFFTPERYIVMKSSSSIYINHTRELLTEKQYFANSTENHDGYRTPVGTIAVCRQHLPSISPCNGTHITLDEDEYVMLPNTSVYRNASNTVYNQDEYSIINGSVVVCTKYSNKYTKRRRTVDTPNDRALLILTYIGLSLSVVCLVFVLVTYLLFEKLRTLPGINLMNLSTALLVNYFFWLIGSGQSGSHGACVAIAVILHYSFLASFAWMSVIAFNTWKAFSSTGRVGRSTDKEYRRKKICRTVAVGWIPVLLLVIVCLTLDQSGAVQISYGGPKGCWINNGRTSLFIFVLPIAMSLVWNGVFFGLTVKAIYEAKKQASMVTDQRKNERHFSVYLKIAILMGFTWIFGFLAILKSSYFKYPFVVLNTLQGVYIAVAFTFNSRIKKLYALKLFRRQITNESNRSSNRYSKTPLAILESRLKTVS